VDTDRLPQEKAHGMSIGRAVSPLLRGEGEAPIANFHRRAGTPSASCAT
jgi:hypothetical protein